MLLSSSGSPEGPITSETRRVAGLLARPKTGEILAHLHRDPYLSASEVARREEIHVATAQRYLKELTEAGLVGTRPRHGGARAVEEYWLLEPTITIRIDLDEAPDEGLAAAARRIAVHDRGPANVVYDTNPRTGDVEGILILSGDNPRLVEDRIRLSTTVGRFLAHLPYSAGHAQSVWDVMQRAGLAEEHLPEVLTAIGRFTRSAGSRSTHRTDHVPRTPEDAEDPEPTPSGSARPLDPEVERIFRSLNRRDRTAGTLQVALFEVVPFEPTPDPGSDADPEGGPDRHTLTPEPQA